MHPRLIDIPTGVDGMGDLVLPSYFTMLAIGLALAIFLARRWGARQGLDPRLIVDFGIWMALWGIVGSRLLHVIADGYFWDYVHVCTDPSLVDWKVDARECAALQGAWDAAREVCHPIETNCWAWADVTAGGYAYYGGLIAAALFSVYFIRKHRLPGPKMLDMAGWTITLGLAWGRMGCFLASCCFGARTDCPLGVVFPSGSAASRKHWQEGLLDTYRVESLPVHPTQVYESLGSLIIAALVYFAMRPRKRFDGQVFAVAMVAYAVLRFLLEFIRRDDRGSLVGLSTSQLIAIGVVAACSWLWVHLGRRSARLLSEGK